MPHLVDDAHHGRGEIDIATFAVKADGNAALDLDAFQLLEEVDMEIGAAELAVGNALEPEIFLESDDIANRLVFDHSLRVAIDLCALVPIARVEQSFGSKEAADVIGTERWGGACGHCRSVLST